MLVKNSREVSSGDRCVCTRICQRLEIRHAEALIHLQLEQHELAGLINRQDVEPILVLSELGKL